MAKRKPSTKAQIAEPRGTSKEQFIAQYGIRSYNRLPSEAKLLWNKLIYIKEEFDYDHCCD